MCIYIYVCVCVCVYIYACIFIKTNFISKCLFHFKSLFFWQQDLILKNVNITKQIIRINVTDHIEVISKSQIVQYSVCPPTVVQRMCIDRIRF